MTRYLITAAAAAAASLALTSTGTCVAAFSSIATSVPPRTTPQQQQQQQQQATPAAQQQQQHLPQQHQPSAIIEDVDEVACWRVVLDIGRGPLANGMPFDWARSGCRMPLVVPCAFRAASSTSSSDQLSVEPISSTVSFTGPDGAVVRPVEGGEWKIAMTEDSERSSSTNTASSSVSPSQLSFALTFPESMERRDVRIDAGTTLQCVGTVYSQSKLDALNQAFYEAREATWKVGTELNNAVSRQGAPKKWNEETQQWEKRYDNENPFTWAQKRVSYWASKAKQSQASKERPSLNSLSTRGRLPTIDDGVYVAKEGVVKAPNGAVMGTWSAEPIID